MSWLSTATGCFIDFTCKSPVVMVYYCRREKRCSDHECTIEPSSAIRVVSFYVHPLQDMSAQGLHILPRSEDTHPRDIIPYPPLPLSIQRIQSDSIPRYMTVDINDNTSPAIRNIAESCHDSPQPRVVAGSGDEGPDPDSNFVATIRAAENLGIGNRRSMPDIPCRRIHSFREYKLFTINLFWRHAR